MPTGYVNQSPPGQPPRRAFHCGSHSRHANVTVTFLSLSRVVLTVALDPECRRSLFLEGVQSELSQRNNDSLLANPLRISSRQDVIAPRGSPIRTLVRVAAMPLLVESRRVTRDRFKRKCANFGVSASPAHS